MGGWCPPLSKFAVVLMDLDGVIWVDGEPIEANLSVARKLADEGRLIVVTNNSTRSRRLYSRALRRLGLNIESSRIVTSGFSAARLLRRIAGKTRVYVVGEEGLVEELAMAGHEILTISEASMAEAVVVGLDRSLTYAKLHAAMKALSRGALFVATNLDHALPSRDGLKPGAGAIVAALEVASGRKHQYNAGKPSRFMLEAALEAYGKRVDKNNIIIVGDRMDTDGAMAVGNGIAAVIVDSGLATKLPEGYAVETGMIVRASSLEELCRRQG